MAEVRSVSLSQHEHEANSMAWLEACLDLGVDTMCFTNPRHSHQRCPFCAQSVHAQHQVQLSLAPNWWRSQLTATTAQHHG